MSLSQSLLPEFDHEMANTRKALKRAPVEHLDFKPHEKSMTFRGLITHLTNLPYWLTLTLERGDFDVAPVGGEPFREEPVDSLEAALKSFDDNVARARAALVEASDESMMAPWSLLSGGKAMITMPRIAMIRSFILNHMIHHRGQLSVYLRLKDVPVPALYGNSADES